MGVGVTGLLGAGSRFFGAATGVSTLAAAGVVFCSAGAGVAMLFPFAGVETGLRAGRGGASVAFAGSVLSIVAAGWTSPAGTGGTTLTAGAAATASADLGVNIDNSSSASAR
jgi:hypothetical protein